MKSVLRLFSHCQSLPTFCDQQLLVSQSAVMSDRTSNTLVSQNMANDLQVFKDTGKLVRNSTICDFAERFNLRTVSYLTDCYSSSLEDLDMRSPNYCN
jgi:hypothetical protein